MTDGKVFDVFLSHNARDKPAVEVLARRLEDEAKLTPWLDKWNLVPGDPWQEAIEQALDDSRTCAVFIGPNGIGPWENEEMRSALQGRVSQAGFRVVPVLLPGATLPESGLPRFLSRLTWVDFRGPDGLSDPEAFQRLVAGIRGVAPRPGQGLVTQPSRQDLLNRHDLLVDVEGEVAGRLTQSLHYAVLINLLKAKHPQEVKRVWDVEVKIGTQPTTSLPADTEIIDVFDQKGVAGRLLILGAPGAGKTTTLLHLARGLVSRAKTDASEPLPVLLNLSSWKDEGQPIASWLVDELHSKYGVHKDIARRWIDERCFVPLLDGLDEVEPARQERCVHAINQFQHDKRPEHLVVCCRLAEYQNCPTKLQLNGAIHLQPLSDEQIRHYLLRAKCPDLWNILKADPDLLELSRSPLLLSMTTLAFGEQSSEDGWPEGSSIQGLRQYLFDSYIERMLARAVKTQYDHEDTLRWLTWLATKLSVHSQAGFLIERLQPTWLQPRAATWTYHICVVLIVAVAVVVADWLREWSMTLVPYGRLITEWDAVIEKELKVNLGAYRSLSDWSLRITIGLVAGLIVGFRQSIRPIETLKWSVARARSRMVAELWRWSGTGLKYGAYIGFIGGLVGWPIFYLTINPSGGLKGDLASELAGWGRGGQIAGVIAGLIAGVAIMAIARPSVWGIGELRHWPALRISVADGLVSGFISGLGVGATAGPVVGGLAGVGIGIVAALGHGMSGRLTFQVTDAVIVGSIAWVTQGLVTWLTGRLLLKALGGGLWGWMDLWVGGWLGVGATVGLAGRLIARLRGNANTVETSQGTATEFRSWLTLRWRWWLIAGVVAALVPSMTLVWLMGWGKMRMVQALALFTSRLGLGFITVLSGSVLTALMAAAIGAALLGALGALFGALSGGLTGPDIERRTNPNQGIQQSAVNIGPFALIGGLMVGSIWALFTLSVLVLKTGHTPGTADWLRVGLGSIVTFGILSGLVPGAAWLQHFTLRFILWCSGSAPWHYARFLNYATERMFVQRVGGRYRFLHGLLRDHFAAMQPKPEKDG